MMSSRVPFAFVHCADLHLDSPFEGLLSKNERLASLLREATFQAFDNVISVAIENNAAFVLISGDIYDGADNSLRAQIRYTDTLARAARHNIRCFAVHGNHDPVKAWRANIAMPPSVHVFGAEKVERIPVVYEGRVLAHIYGISHAEYRLKQNLAAKFRRQQADEYAIGLLHCNVGACVDHDDYAPCTMADLYDANMDYWALGHIHSRTILSDKAPLSVYPGNTQGRSIKETGEKGCYLVRVQADGSTDLEFHATDVLRWFRDDLTISETETIDSLRKKLFAKQQELRVQAKQRGSISRLTITGRSSLHEMLRQNDIVRDLLADLNEGEERRSDFAWFDSIAIKTRPAVDIDKRREVPDLVGDYLRAADALRQGTQTAESVREVLLSRPESNKIKQVIMGFSEQELLDLLDAAEISGLDLLLAGEDVE
ncbi:DNA repair exonuclease [Anaerospora hongkongensis]|uniref:metallophosphoesterase family protein n=1 Tax=Anaerospora hongkongensis TaxID=244830 RepID=UPI002FDAD7A1